MKFGVRIYGIDSRGLIAAARRAEQLGYESLWRGDHVVLPADESSDAFSTPMPLRADSPLLDSLMVFSHLAAETQTVKLCMGILVAPLRNPFLVARSVLTLDRLSQGRALLGLGAGWIKDEYDIMQLDFSRRGRRMNEFIEVVRSLWISDVAEYVGEFYQFDPVRFEPKPICQPHPPIIIGGESQAAVERAARLGDGWYSHMQPIESLTCQINELLELRATAGRTLLPFEVTVSVPASVDAGTLRAFEEIGVARVMMEIGDVNLEDGSEVIPQIERFRGHMSDINWER